MMMLQETGGESTMCLFCASAKMRWRGSPMLFEDVWRFLNTQALCLRIEQVHSDGHDHAHASKEKEEAPAH